MIVGVPWLTAARLLGDYGKPKMIVSGNGTELTSMAILRWAQEHRVEWHYIAPGKPHLGLDKDTLLRRAVQRTGTIVATPILSGLHHRYAQI
jgi:transposase InsO family protein